MKTGSGEESAIEIEKRETSEERCTRFVNSFNLCELERSATCLYSSNKKEQWPYSYFLISGVAKKVHMVCH